MVTAFIGIVLAICLFLGIPIFMSLSIPSFLALNLFTEISVEVMVQRFFGGLDKFGLMAMPLFIFGAEIMLQGGIARKLLDFTKYLVSWLPGGTAFTTHISCLFFGALCGSSPATVAAIGGVMYPELRADNYDEDFSVGLITSSSAVALLIPPSVTMILYGVATGTSVGGLFVGGIGAGIVYSLVLSVYIFYWVLKKGDKTRQAVSFKGFGKVAVNAIPAMLIPVIILGGIYGGIFTPTEAAAVSTAFSIFVSIFIYKELTFKKLWQACINSSIVCAQVLILTSAAAALGWVLTVFKVPQSLAEGFLNTGASQAVFLLFVNVIFLIAGMFMDGSGAVTLLAPLVYPIGLAMGVHPVHLGVLVTTNIAIGNMTPPVGLNLFVANGVTGLPLTKIIKAVTPFLIAALIALALITYIPEITLFLVRMAYPATF